MEVNEWFVHHKKDRLDRKDILKNNVGRGKEIIACNIRRDADAHRISAVNELYDLVELVYNSFGGGRVITFSEADVEEFRSALSKARGGHNAS